MKKNTFIIITVSILGLVIVGGIIFSKIYFGKNYANQSSFLNQQRCAEGANEFYKKEGYKTDDTLSSYTNHYNQKLNKCFIEINSNNYYPFAYSVLYDAYEGKIYAELNLINSKISFCKILDNECKSEEEFDDFVKSYMEN